MSEDEDVGGKLALEVESRALQPRNDVRHTRTRQHSTDEEQFTSQSILCTLKFIGSATFHCSTDTASIWRECVFVCARALCCICASRGSYSSSLLRPCDCRCVAALCSPGAVWRMSLLSSLLSC